MYSSIFQYIQSCVNYQQAKRYIHGRKAPLVPLSIPNHTFYTWNMDFIGPLKETPKGYKHILILTCTMSKHKLEYCIQKFLQGMEHLVGLFQIEVKIFEQISRKFM